MNCPSNPRERAFKRNYRCLFLVMFMALCVNADAFAPNTRTSSVAQPKVSTTTKYPTLLHLTPNNNKDKNKKESLTHVGIATTSTFFEQEKRTTRFDQLTNFVSERAPGVALAAALGQLSIAVSKTALGTHVSPLLWATIFGMVYGNCLHKGDAKRTLASGIKFSKGRLLRLGIILYGFKITLQQIAGIGFAGLATDAFIVASTLFLGVNLGQKVFGLDETTSTLIGSGAAICGCSAVLATQPVVGGESHQVSAAVGTVVIGGTLSMFLYPFLFKWIPCLAASPKLMGVFTGSTIHEIAGVVAAGKAMGGEVAVTAVVTKLARVLLLAPALMSLSWFKNRKCIMEAKAAGKPVEQSGCKIVLPWFAFGFVGLSALNSFLPFPAAMVKIASKTSAFSLICAMAALGIESDLVEIRKLGSKPVLLAALLWVWLTVGGLGAARFFLGI
mmetsp:Transcript_11695/g.28108  ORF Transcript_11695/g.28108 Transcript_11695/m.28108 type:complete len:445 (+) Transcript_11695:133-1467(+)|eukprot:CAMPEP_0113620392 /NCGR_PEP_ID=MMETSP0017_2-20120614/10390_1 /TAXON_ID=2856 /ORGANISM="Cylindrotheca closterium" /LENGTH=444 /DNA_ID=CAMNT_0000530053 /DNA_START=107 /DNA_END=1441 /DNA_ORIENTATION=+ /assembly_acc=CAM_ASM_000147